MSWKLMMNRFQCTSRRTRWSTSNIQMPSGPSRRTAAASPRRMVTRRATWCSPSPFLSLVVIPPLSLVADPSRLSRHRFSGKQCSLGHSYRTSVQYDSCLTTLHAHSFFVAFIVVYFTMPFFHRSNLMSCYIIIIPMATSWQHEME